MRLTVIGAGNLASSLAPAIVRAGHTVVQVYSRTRRSADALASAVGASAVTDLRDVGNSAEVYVLAVSDDAIVTLLPVLCAGKDDKVFIHTAGSVPMSVFGGFARHCGVLYPMQTFSKSRTVDMRHVPLFIEASDSRAEETVTAIARSLSDNVTPIDSDGRQRLHIAAVFACNFVNHCYTLAADILAEEGLPFDILLPLIDETTRKAHVLPPLAAQTGPAARGDNAVIDAHTAALAATPDIENVYGALTRSIRLRHATDNNKTKPQRND